MSRGNGEEHTDVVEMDAMDVDDWDRDRHTPVASDGNLAALVKQSAVDESKPTAKPGARLPRQTVPTPKPVLETLQTSSKIAPVLDEGWDDGAKVESPKTSQNTVRRTSAIPIVQPAPSTPRRTAALPSVTANEPRTPPALTKKPMTSAAPAKPAPSNAAAPAKVTAPKSIAPAKSAPVKSIASIVNPTAPAQVTTQPTKPGSIPSVAKPGASARPALVSAPPATSIPTAPRPQPAKPIATAPVSEPPKRISEPARLPPPPEPARVADPDDWGPKTSITNQLASPPPASRDLADDYVEEPREPSVIIDLNSKAPRKTGMVRAQSPVVLLTSEQNATTSGVFMMPTAASPNATRARSQVPPSSVWDTPSTTHADPVSSPPSPHEPVPPSQWDTPSTTNAAPVFSPPSPFEASSFTPMQQQSAPPPRIADLAAIPQPLAHVEATERRIVPRSVLASVLPTPRRRRIALIGGGVIAVLVLAFALSGGKNTSHAAVVEPTRAAKPTAPSAQHVATADKPAVVEPATLPAPAVAPAATPAPSPTPKPAPRRQLRAKKPVVVDYDKQKDAQPDHDESLARARAAYAVGNQHLFAGETEAAVTAYRKALASYPTYVAGYRGLGLAFSQQGDRAAAIKAFKTYVALAPTAKDVALIKKRIARLSAAL